MKMKSYTVLMHDNQKCKVDAVCIDGARAAFDFYVGVIVRTAIRQAHASDVFAMDLNGNR